MQTVWSDTKSEFQRITTKVQNNFLKLLKNLYKRTKIPYNVTAITVGCTLTLQNCQKIGRVFGQNEGRRNMRKTLNRILACCLALALLISCCISGLILPVAAEPQASEPVNLFPNGDFEGELVGTGWNAGNLTVDATGGVDGSTGIKFAKNAEAANASALSPLTDIPLVSPLKAGKTYMFRYTKRGGKSIVYSGNPAVNLKNENVNYQWVEMQCFFTPSADIEKINELYLYNNTYQTDDVWFDNFELYEYQPGMNLMTGADGSVLGGNNYADGKNLFLGSVMNDYGATLEVVTDPDDATNKVWKLTAGTNNIGWANLAVNAPNFPVAAGDIVKFSYRFKPVVENQAVGGSMSDAAHGKKLESFLTGKDDNGWLTATGWFQSTDGNITYLLPFHHSTADGIYFDDFYLAETLQTASAQTVSEMKLSPEAVSAAPGSKILLTAQGKVDGVWDANAYCGDLTWESSNTAVATVEAATGYVTVVGNKVEGDVATITAKNADNTLVATATVEADYYSELIKNGSFEDADTSAWAHLLKNEADSVFAIGDTFGAPVGSSASSKGLHIKSSDARSCYYVGDESAAERTRWNNLLLPNREYTISLKIKGTSTLRVWADAGLDTVSVANASFSGTYEDWTPITRTFKTGDNTTINYFAFVIDAGTSDFYLDDISLKLKEEPNVMQITEETLTLVAGDSRDLTFKARPLGTAITWQSSDNAVATVANGKVTAVANGTATITATTTEGMSDTVTVTVSPKATGLVMSQATLYLAPGTVRTLSASATPAGSSAGTVTWASSNTAVATVDPATGLVKAVADGAATITATSTADSSITAQCAVTVDAFGERLVSGDFEADTDASVWTWSITKDGVGSVIPEPGNETNHVLSMSANQTGYYGGLNVELGEIYELTGRVKGKNKPAIYLMGGRYVTFPIPGTTAWTYPGTSDTEWTDFKCIFQVKLSGGATSLEKNYTLLLGNKGDGIAYFDDLKLVKRTPPSLESITVTPETALASIGDTVQLTAAPNPDFVDVELGTVTWSSSNTAVATVDASTGLVTAVGLGTATITAKNQNNKQGTATISVVTPASELVLSDTTYSFGPGGSHILNVSVKPAGSYKGTLTWSSDDESIVKVDQDGLITGVAVGTATVKVENERGKFATCTVSVEEYGNILTGGDFEDDNDTKHWASALALGSASGATIIAEPGNETNHVLSIPASPDASNFWKYTAGYQELPIKSNETYVLTGRVKGKNKPGINIDQTYTTYPDGTTAHWNYCGTSDDDWQEFTLMFKTKADAANYTSYILRFANCGGGVCYFDDLKLTKRVPPTLTGIAVSQAELTYGVGVTKQLYAVEQPTDAIIGNLTWKSSNTAVATVDATGKLTTVGAGKATITVSTDKNFSATCTVTVVNTATDFALAKESIKMVAGATANLHVNAIPVGADTGTLQWRSSDEAVATVANGVVTAVADGTATITVTNGTITDTCVVTVTEYGELIVGGDFEDSTVPTNWNDVLAGGKAAVQADDDDDTNSLLVINAGQTTGFYKGITLQNGETYRFTARAKGYAATIKLPYSAKGIAMGGGNHKTTTDLENWNTITFVFRTNAEGTLPADELLQFVGDANGNTYIDDISVVKLPKLTGISLAETEHVAPNNGFAMEVTPVPADAYIEGTVQWTSSDSSVISVDASGKVSALKEGTATVTATVGSFSDTTVFTVSYGAPLIRNGDFAAMSLYWKADKKDNLIAVREGVGEAGGNGMYVYGPQSSIYYKNDLVVVPNNTYKVTVRYKSNDMTTDKKQSSVRVWGSFGSQITLNNTHGEWVTAERTFTVPTNWVPGYGYDLSIVLDDDLAEEQGMVIGNIDLRLYDSGVDATEVTLSPGNLTLTPGQSATIGIALTPVGANPNFMVWNSDNQNVVIVENGVITAVGGGVAKVTARAESGAVGTATVTVTGPEAYIKNPTFDIADDTTSWVLSNAAAIAEGAGYNGTKALELEGGSETATQVMKNLKAGTTYQLMLRARAVGSAGGEFTLTQAGASSALAVFKASGGTAWSSLTYEFTTADDFDGSDITLTLAATGNGGTLYLDNVMVVEGYSDADLIVSDIMWNNNETQMKPGTKVNFTVVLANIGTEDSKANKDIVVELRVNAKVIRTMVLKGGIKKQEVVILTTDKNDPWIATAGELVISAHVNTTLSVLEKSTKNNGMQVNIRVADTFLEAPEHALEGGFNNLVFSDDFDFANVDNQLTGEYGYKWYLRTPYGGVDQNPGDYELTDDGIRLIDHVHDYNWTMCTIDPKTGAGWNGYRFGYLEFRLRMPHLRQIEGTEGSPAVWSFPTEKVLNDSSFNRWVEMDWMENWGDQYGDMHWTITMHDMTMDGSKIAAQYKNNNTFGIRGKENDVSDGEWHILGFRWDKGYVIGYLDNREIFRQTYDPVEGADPPAATVVGMFSSDALCPMDTQVLQLIISGSVGWPLELDYIRVWQSDGTVEADPIVDTSFAKEHLTDDNGELFTDVTADNYQAIIDSVEDWLQLTEEQQNQINKMLTDNGGKDYATLLFEAQTLAGDVANFVSFYACDESGTPYTAVTAENREWILSAQAEWEAMTDLQRAAINAKVLELCGMTFDDMLAAAENYGKKPSPDAGVPFPTIALVGLFLGGAAVFGSKKRRNEK